LAELPGEMVQTKNGPYYFKGRHRLWHVPESMPPTYHPDDEPVEIHQTSDHLCLTQFTEARSGIQKRLEIQLDQTKSQLILNHGLLNRGEWPITTAPWAITMFPPGGVALLPIGVESEDVLLPTQHLTMWPYTRLADSRLKLGDSLLLVQGKPPPDLKSGLSINLDG
jgi:hypothetical protein